MILSSINSAQRKFRRELVDKSYRKKLLNSDFTIFSSNCVGGVIYNSLGHRFLSPTINLYFGTEDYLRFLQNPGFYVSNDAVFREIEDTGEAWPVVGINDIKVHFMHYHNYTEAVNKWKERSKRINWNNIYVIFSEGSGCVYSDIVAFDNLNYANKVIFTHREMTEIKSSVFLHKAQWTTRDGIVRLNYPLTGYINKISPLRYIDEFDYVEFINRREEDNI